MKAILTRTSLALALLTTALVFAASAQQPAPQREGAPEQMHGRHMGRKHGMGRGHHGRLGFLRGLDLTDAQREQIRQIAERFHESLKPQHEELRAIMRARHDGGQLTDAQKTRAEQLHTEIRAARQRFEQEVLGVLTPEQRAKAEQFLREREQRREQFRERRRNRPTELQ